MNTGGFPAVSAKWIGAACAACAMLPFAAATAPQPPTLLSAIELRANGAGRQETAPAKAVGFSARPAASGGEVAPKVVGVATFQPRPGKIASAAPGGAMTFAPSANDSWHQRKLAGTPASAAAPAVKVVTGPQPAADVTATTTIYDAWLSAEVDMDSDSYVRSFTLNWDPDVVGSTGSLSVFEKLYYKPSAGSTWTLFHTTAAHTITGESGTDGGAVPVNGSSHGLYDYKIELYRADQTVPDYISDPSNDSDLNDHPEETSTEDSPTGATISGTVWNDTDGDGAYEVGEPGLAGRVVYLDQNQNGVRDSGETYTTSDANGSYTFTGLAPATYYVTQERPVGFRQTLPGPAGATPSQNFQIDVVFTDTSLTGTQRAAFNLAAARWARIITADLPDVIAADGLPVDDVRINARGRAIDGVGGVLGQAGPTEFRATSSLPTRGSMEFDTADLADMESNGRLVDVILHEMGHVLGFGTIWEDRNVLTGAGTADPRFTGAGATAEYNSIFAVSGTSVPVEGTPAGVGTRDSHWRESVFVDELMTGWISGNIRPLSRITAASLADLGYTVNLNAADVYTHRPFDLAAHDASLEGGRILAIANAPRIISPLRPRSVLADTLTLVPYSYSIAVVNGEVRTGENFGNQADTTAPTVTINQAADQADPTSSSSVNFTVVFSETVTGFSSSDVTLAGTAGATTKIVTGSGTTYNVAVGGMTQSGTIIATIPAGAAQDGAGNASTASTSSDNTVTYGAPAAGSLQFSAAAYSVNESGTSATLTVTRTGGSTGAVGVSYATSNGTATAGSDYTAASGTLNWADGDAASKTFIVAITDDTMYEGANETINLTLSNATGGAILGGQASAVLTIIENDTASGPVIGTQPVNQTVVTGGAATFTVAATGSGTLAYRWYFTPVGSTTPQGLNDIAGKLAGTHAATLTVSNVQATDAGDYVCIVTDSVGSSTSHAAQLSVADRLVKIVSQTAAPGVSVIVPVQLIAHGDENALGFSVNFDASKLTFVSAAAGAQAADVTLNTNSAQAATGKIGFGLAKPSGAVWTAGTQEIVKITFTLASTVPETTVVPLTFGDVPVTREVSSAGAVALPAAYQGGSVTALSGYEADMNGNGAVTITDWVKVGRIVAGLDPTPTGTDFMKADCAPRSSLGNGALSITDWVQAGRYAAGLDPLTAAGGPAAP